MNVFRVAKTEPILPVWATLGLAVLAAGVSGSVSSGFVLLLALCVVLQMIVGNTQRVAQQAIPLARIDLRSVAMWRERVRVVVLWALSFTPGFAMLSSQLAASWFFGCFLGYAPQALELAQRVLRARTERRNLAEELARTPYEVVVFIAGPREAAYQINQWLPVLEILPFRVALLTPSFGMLAGMHATKLPIYFARGFAQIESFLEAGPQVVLYPANPVDNARPLRQYRLRHLFINHGESDKAVNQSKLLMAYDKLLVGGPLAERRLRDAGLPLRAEQVVHVGRPQAELRLAYVPERRGPLRRILYAPTWEGLGDAVDYGSVSEFGDALVSALLRDGRFEVHFKPHPFTGTRSSRARDSLARIRAKVSSSKGRVLGDADSLHDAMNWSDLLITDVSSVLNEYLVTGKPVVLCNPRGFEPERLAREFPSSVAAYVLDSGGEVTELLGRVSADDFKRESRRDVRRDSLGDADTSALTRFEAAIRSQLVLAREEVRDERRAGEE